MRDLDKFIRRVLSVGKYDFSSKDAIAYLKCSAVSFRMSIKNRIDKGQIISPARGLYIIIPPEYETIGCLPANDLIPILFQFWGYSYYVCLLSAAMYHGASHQKPQIFQVMSSHRIKNIKCGKIIIEVIYKKSLYLEDIDKFDSKTGTLIVSSVENTIYDLFFYPNKSGGYNNIATIISELLQKVNLQKMTQVIKRSPYKFWMQRLGYILECIESEDEKKKEKLMNILSKYICSSKTEYLPLIPDISIKRSKRHKRWKLIINEKIEED